MKRFILVFILVLTANTASADLVGDLEARYNKLKSWQAEFDQTTYVEMLKQTLKKNGRIYVSRPDKIRVEYLSRPHKIYTSDGKKLWIYKQDELTAWQFNKPKKVISKEALSFLSGLKNMSSIFDVETNLKEPEGYLKIQNTSLAKVHLIPKTQDALLKIVLGVDEKTQTVKEAVLFNTTGNVTHYQFNNIVFDSNLSEGLFTLPAEPKRKIIKK